MRHDDLLREIRDSIRANTAIVNQLHDYLLLMNSPMITIDPTYTPPTTGVLPPGTTLFADQPNGPGFVPPMTDDQGFPQVQTQIMNSTLLDPPTQET